LAEEGSRLQFPKQKTMEILKFCNSALCYIYRFVDETKAGKADGGRGRGGSCLYNSCPAFSTKEASLSEEENQ
jgi:hypothetical protein